MQRALAVVVAVAAGMLVVAACSGRGDGVSIFVNERAFLLLSTPHAQRGEDIVTSRAR